MPEGSAEDQREKKLPRSSAIPNWEHRRGLTKSHLNRASETRVKPAVLDRFRNVLGVYIALLREVGHGASHAQHAVVAARRKKQPSECMPQELVAFAVGGAVAVDFLGAKKRVRLALPLHLKLPCPFHSIAD